MAAQLHYLEQRRLIDSNGIADDATIGFYSQNTLNPISIYADSSLSVPLENPLPVSAGAAVPNIYYDDTLNIRRIITYSDGSTDDANPYQLPSSLADAQAAADAAAADAAQTALDRIATAADVVAAETAKTDTQTIADAALAASNIFADTTAGIAGTTDGDYFFVEDANDDLQLYLNDAGTAVAQDFVLPGRAALDEAIATISTARAERLTSSVKAAGGDNVKLLSAPFGTKTFRSGTTDEIETLQPLIGGTTLVQPATTWNGGGTSQALRPKLTATGDGIEYHSQSAFDLPDGILTTATDFAIDYVVSFPSLATTYTTKAAADAAVGSHVINDIIEVTDDTNTTFTPDPAADYIASGAYAEANMVNGYYFLNWQGQWKGLGENYIFALVDTGVSNRYIRIGVDKRGFVFVAAFDATLSATLRTTAYNIFEAGQSKKQHFRIEADDGVLRLRVNGDEIFAFKGELNISTFDRLYVNGSSRGGNASLPINGGIYTEHCLAITEGLNFTQRRLVSDAIAEEFGTPKQPFNPVAKCVVVIGQSNEFGTRASDETDARTVWDGNVDSEATGRSASLNWRTQEFIPQAFGTDGAANGGNFGPLNVSTNNFGNVTRAFTGSGSGLETIEWGFFKQLFTQAPEAQQHDWYMIGDCHGGYSLAMLQEQSGDDIWSIKSGDLADYTANFARDAINALFARLIEHCAKRGQTVDLRLVYQGQGETTAGTGLAYGPAYETDARQWIVDELLTLSGQKELPWFFLKEIAYSSTGVDNTRNTSTFYYDNQRRELEANRDKDFRIIYVNGLTGLYGYKIHKGVRLRLLGEYMGRIFANIEYKSASLDFGQLKVVSATINGSNQIEVLFNQDITTATKFPDVPDTLQTGGSDTYGFVFEPDASLPSRAITGVSIAGSTATISVDGGGAITGDAILITGEDAPFTNIRATTSVTGLYPDIDFTLPFGGTDSPIISEDGSLADLTPWAPAGRWLLS